MKKNILLIGGSQGIGLATAEMIVQDYAVIVASRTSKNLETLDITHLEFDVTRDEIKDLDLPDCIHGLVYFPGSINLKPFRSLKHNDFQEDMQINFLSLVKVVQGLLPRLQKSNEASLVFFSSVAVKVGMPYHTSVSASKGAIEGFAKALAAEYAPFLRVNVIAPSLTDTPLAGKLLSSEEKKRKMDLRHPLKRIGTPQDIANMVVFLLSEKSSWITGQVLGIDGGLSGININ